ncbi:hypothetical protein ES703_83924 [subsurface metagenome]
MVINFPTRDKELVKELIGPLWRDREAAELIQENIELQSDDAEDKDYLHLARAVQPFGYVGLLIPFSEFELQPLMRIILLVAFFSTVFLIIFLIFNLRPDPSLVMRQRIKHFQLEVLQELIEHNEKIDWERWRRELMSGRSDLKQKFKKGIGRISAGKEAEVDSLIDRGWDEIIGIIETRVESHKREMLDPASVEKILQRALERGGITLAATAVVERSLPGPKPAAVERKPIEVEEIGIEEVSEGPVEEAEAVEEVEAVEEIEEVEEAEVLEEAVEEAEVVEEVEAVEEAEALEEVKAVEEAEAVEEIEEVEEAEAEEKDW